MRIAALTLLLGSLGLAACNDTNDDTNNDVLVAPSSSTGTFVLKSVNGREVPAIVLDSTNLSLTVEAISGAIALGSNNVFIDATGFRFTLGVVDSTHTVICAGRFTVAADTLTFVELASTECGRTFTGVLHDNSLVASVRGVAAVYGR